MADMSIDTFCGVRCDWKAELIDPKTNEIVEIRDWQKNTVLNSGLSSLISPGTTPFYNTNGGTYLNIAVGTGTTEPAPEQTQLANFLGYKIIDLTNSSGTYVNSADMGTPIVYTYSTKFGVSEVVGTISEFGLTSSSTNAAGSYFCRNLVRSGSNPSPIVKDNSHELKVYLHISFFRPTGCVWVDSMTSSGAINTAYSITGCVNNQWVIQSLLHSKNHATGRYIGWTGGGYVGASTSYAPISSSGNIIYSDLVTPSVSTNTDGVVGASGITTMYNGVTYDNYYYRDVSVTIPKSELNINIRSMYIKGFFQQSALTGISGITGEGGFFMQFNPVLAKTSSHSLTFNFRHYYFRM